MAEKTNLFICPTCGAPLEPPVGASTMKCGYCSNSIIIPESARSGVRIQGFEGGMIGMDLKDLTSQAKRLKEVRELALAGNKIEAIRRFREITSVGLKQAKDAVEAMAEGKMINIQMGGETTVSPQVISSLPEEMQPRIHIDSEKVRKAGRGIDCGIGGLILFILAVTIIPILFAMGAPGGPLAGVEAQINPAAFARPILTFGEQGSGAGMLDDPRSIAVDGDGNIYVADYSDGRVQAFDAMGKFLNLISVGAKNYIGGMAASRDGTLYIAYSSDIWIYNGKTGQALGKIEYADDHYFDDVTIGADGSIYTVSRGEDILRFSPQGQILLSIPDAISSVSGDSELDTKIAVDGLGNIYALGTFNYSVFKFSPEGRYQNRFGSEGEGDGKFRAPYSITVDGYGRIFVGDIWGVQVFDSQGLYIKTFDDPSASSVIFGMAFDSQNNLYAASNKPQVIKFQIKKPE
jgi:sugar lactone lactonase YvrE/DNA-directed RNA polymerase subunit RPC12/RpoP